MLEFTDFSHCCVNFTFLSLFRHFSDMVIKKRTKKTLRYPYLFESSSNSNEPTSTINVALKLPSKIVQTLIRFHLRNILQGKHKFEEFVYYSYYLYHLLMSYRQSRSYQIGLQNHLLTNIMKIMCSQM